MVRASDKAPPACAHWQRFDEFWLPSSARPFGAAAMRRRAWAEIHGGPPPERFAIADAAPPSAVDRIVIDLGATLAALTGPQDCVETMRKAFDERRLEMVKLLRAIPGVTCREPKGAFYAFPDVSAHVGKTTPEGSILDDDVQLCDWLVEVGKVAVVPGSGFGAPGYVRLSYACSMENIKKGVGRLAEALGRLK